MKKIFAILCLLGSYSIANAQVPSYVPTNRLIGWWPFSGNANDLSGNGHNGTVNGATLTNERYGNTSAAYTFDGVNDYISVLNNSKLVLDSSFSISCWVNIKGLNTFNAILSNASNDQSSVSGWVLGYANFSQPSKIHFQAYPFFDNSTISQQGNNLTNNIWKNIIITYNFNIGQLKYYVDGQLTDTFKRSYYLVNSNLNLYFGNHFQNNNPSASVPTNCSFNGSIDEIGIWKRVLNSSEISQLYKACNKKIASQPNNIITNGKKAVFTCQANDSLQTYQWQILANGNWVVLKDSAQYSGTKTSQLTINQLLVKNNGQKYRCLVKGNCLNTISEEATLTYNCKVSITKQPANQGMFAGNATFTCATNDTLVNYQWQTNSGTGWNNLFNAGQYTGSNTNNLLVSNVTSSNNNQLFRCIIKGDCLTDTSKEATLRVWVLGVQSEQVQAFKVYPNPTKGQITIENIDLSKMIGYGLRIYNSLGQQQFQSSVSQERFTLDLNQLGGEGIYFMELTDNNGNVVDVKKIVLQ